MPKTKRNKKLDASESLPPAPKEPDLVDTVRELPEYFPSSRSPERWVDWLCESNPYQWQIYLEGRTSFERQHRQWQAEKAKMERERDDLVRRNVLEVWISIREEAWKTERIRWTAEKKALLLERDRVVQAVASTVGYTSRSIEKAKKKRTSKKLMNLTQSTVPVTDGQPVVESGAIAAVGQVPVEGTSYQSSGDASAPSPLDPDEEAPQRKIEGEPLASDVSVSRQPPVTDRLHGMLLERAELITLRRQLNGLPEWTPEEIRQTSERLVREYDAAVPEFQDLFDPLQDGILMDDEDPKRVGEIIEEKLEDVLSTSANSIRMIFLLTLPEADGGSERTRNALQLFEKYGLCDYTTWTVIGGQRGVIVQMSKEQLEAWILLYCERARRDELEQRRALDGSYEYWTWN